MNIIGTVAATLQSALGPSLDTLGRQTGAIRRRRKFSGASLLKTLVLTLMRKPNADSDDFAATAAQLGVPVTPEAVEERFTERRVAFLRAGLESVLGPVVQADPLTLPVLAKFTAVEIGDSTTITLPDQYAAEFPGCGGKTDSGQAAVTLQVVWELRTGALTRLEAQPGRESDATSRVQDEAVIPGSLSLRDLGYFDLERFRMRGAGGAYWISRWQPGTAVFTPDGQPLEVLAYVQQRAGDGPIDEPILLGATQRLPCRLIVLRVPPEVANRRRQKVRQKAQKHGRTPSVEQLAWCDWTILLTNCPATLLSWKEVVVLYRSRWQIELMFRLWKSHNHVAAYRPNWTTTERMAVFWAKLIGVVLQHWLLLTTTGSDVRRSRWKAARVIQDWIVTWARALDDLGTLALVLKEMGDVIRSIARQKRQKKRPGWFQLVSDPELLNWTC